MPPSFCWLRSPVSLFVSGQPRHPKVLSREQQRTVAILILAAFSLYVILVASGWLCFRGRRIARKTKQKRQVSHEEDLELRTTSAAAQNDAGHSAQRL